MQTSMIMAEKEEKTFGKLKPAGDPNAEVCLTTQITAKNPYVGLLGINMDLLENLSNISDESSCSFSSTYMKKKI